VNVSAPKTSSASSNIAIYVSIETPAGLCLSYKGREAGGETINSLVCDLLVSRRKFKMSAKCTSNQCASRLAGRKPRQGILPTGRRVTMTAEDIRRAVCPTGNTLCRWVLCRHREQK
jgi:hypothetical protein